MNKQGKKTLYAGFDLGGTQLKYGLIDEKGIVVFHAKVNTPEKMEDLLQLLKNLWKSLKKREKKHIVSIGLGFPGIFSLKEQKIIQSPNYPSIDKFDLISALSQFIEVSFFVDNDANMAAYGEYKLGSGQGAQSLVLLTIGTGVGTGVILEGKVWHGACGFAGELGHATVNPDGERCKCGSQGCLETEVSALKIVKNYKALTKQNQNITAKQIFHRAKSGDAAARQAFTQAGRFLGIGISIAINLLNPEKVLLGGGVMKAGNLLLSSALEEAKKRSYKASFECCTIEKATLGNRAGFIGAAFWAQEQYSK